MQAKAGECTKWNFYSMRRINIWEVFGNKCLNEEFMLPKTLCIKKDVNKLYLLRLFSFNAFSNIKTNKYYYFVV